MKNSAQNEINIARVTQNRVNLTELLKGYESINKFSSLCKRIKKSSNKKTIALVYVTVVFFFIAIVCCFTAKNLEVLYIPFLMCLIALVITALTIMNNQQRDEVINCRYDEIYELLVAKGVNSENIQDVIDYFRSDLEAVNLLDAKSPILNIILEFARSFFFLSLTHILTLLTADYIPQNRMWIYEISLIIIFISYVIILLIMLYKLANKDTFSPKIRKIVVELKKIDVLNRLKITPHNQE